MGLTKTSCIGVLKALYEGYANVNSSPSLPEVESAPELESAPLVLPGSAPALGSVPEPEPEPAPEGEEYYVKSISSGPTHIFSGKTNQLVALIPNGYALVVLTPNVNVIPKKYLPSPSPSPSPEPEPEPEPEPGPPPKPEGEEYYYWSNTLGPTHIFSGKTNQLVALIPNGYALVLIPPNGEVIPKKFLS